MSYEVLMGVVSIVTLVLKALELGMKIYDRSHNTNENR